MPENPPSAAVKCAVACEYCRAKKVKCDENQPCKNCVTHGRDDRCNYPPPRVKQRRTAKEKQRLLQERLQRAEGLLQAAGLAGGLGGIESDAQPTSPRNQQQEQSRQDRGTSEGVGETDRRSYSLSNPAATPSHSRPTETLLSTISNSEDCTSPTAEPISEQGSLNNSEQNNSLNISDKAHPPQQQRRFRSASNIPFPSPPRTLDEQYNSVAPGLEGSISLAQMLNATPHEQPEAPSPSDFRRSAQQQAPTSPSTQIDWALVAENLQLQNPEVMVQEESPTQGEVHGPGSYLSICSQAGVKWVFERTGSSNFGASASDLAAFVASILKLHQTSKIERIAEPDGETAWKYSHAFFDESLDATMNFIHRETFEVRLRAHLAAGGTNDADDLAWYALRNVVYACGSRIAHYREGQATSWLDAQQHGWKYFQNAFSVHSDLIYSWSSVVAVQALFLMSLYVEGIGAPKLEYMLVSNAFRLAQAKGLALQSSSRETILSENEVETQRWLFWSIYIYEKHISFRSRRPSAIDDDEIECPLPRFAPDGNDDLVDVIKAAININQISSTVMKELLSIKSRRKSPASLIETVQRLEARLKHWRETCPHYLKPQIPINSATQLPAGVLLKHVLWMHFSYYGILAAIHSRFACPWNFPNIKEEGEQSEITRRQIEQSIQTVADSARNMILATKSIIIDADAPCWLTFLFPLMGVINLFTYILTNPSAPTVPADINLLDMGAGYFGYLGFSTLSEFTVTFAKDITEWARASTARGQPQQCTLQGQAHLQGLGGVRHQDDNSLLDDTLPQAYEYGDLSRCGLVELDDWPTFFTL